MCLADGIYLGLVFQMCTPKDTCQIFQTIPSIVCKVIRALVSRLLVQFLLDSK